MLNIEDTSELPGELMRRLGYKVQTILVDERMDGDQSSGSDEALRLSLRMGESAIVLGEIRGEEARTLYQSMIPDVPGAPSWVPSRAIPRNRSTRGWCTT